MANIHRRTKRIIRKTVKALERGEIPMPPEPRKLSPLAEEWTLEELANRRKQIDPTLKQISDVTSRQADKTRIRLEDERSKLDEILKRKKKPK